MGTMKPPDGLPHTFGKFFAFDKGQCTAPDCGAFFEKYGYPVGCQRQVDNTYENGMWYSLPGACPLTPLPAKDPGCLEQQPGGRCSSPTGEKTCTWTYEDAGHVDIAELEGISDYDSFCWSGGSELSLAFWEGRGNPDKSAERVRQVKRLFKTKYPLDEELSDPMCDWT